MQIPEMVEGFADRQLFGVHALHHATTPENSVRKPFAATVRSVREAFVWGLTCGNTRHENGKCSHPFTGKPPSWKSRASIQTNVSE